MTLETLNPETRNLIAGRLVEASNGRRFDNLNPATEEVLGATADGTLQDMDTAIHAARHAFDHSDWSRNAEKRARCLRQLYEGLREAREQLRAIVVREAGAPVSLTGFMQVDEPIEMLSYWADLATQYEYETPLAEVPFAGRPQRRRMQREAIGVVGAITPWNVPLYLNIAKLGPALAAGCTLVLKPAPDTPWCATHIGRIAACCSELPPGVLNIVAGADHRLGERLALDPRVDMVSFTGSTATGRRVMSAASATIKKVFLELGGKSAAIVRGDADLDAVLPGAAMTCVHGGQGCAITTRWLVPRSLAKECNERLRAAFEAWRYGDPEDPANLQGPQISRLQQQRVHGFIERGKREGARCLVGGNRHEGRGFFVPPALFVNVEPEMEIARQEIFGPVCAVIPYDDDEDALRIANASVYGLSGAVYGRDEARCLALARRIRSGTISVNGGMWFHVDTPFGGYKQSGLGRENGRMGFEEYLETKVMALPGAQGLAL